MQIEIAPPTSPSAGQDRDQAQVLATRRAAQWREVATLCAQLQAAVLAAESLCREVTQHMARRRQSIANPYQVIKESRCQLAQAEERITRVV